MEIYSTEEEQVQAIKQWWKNNAVSIILGLVIGITVIAGYRYWNTYQETQSQRASEIYNKIELAEGSDNEKNTEILKNDYTTTPYASLASLLLAKKYIDKNEIDKAINQFNWILTNSHDDGVKHIARQRLARLYLAEKKIELAETLVKDVKAAGFAAAYDEIRGDINLAKNMTLQARENYRIALAALSANDQRYAIIKMKLDDLMQPVTGVKTR